MTFLFESTFETKEMLHYFRQVNNKQTLIGMQTTKKEDNYYQGHVIIPGIIKKKSNESQRTILT